MLLSNTNTYDRILYTYTHLYIRSSPILNKNNQQQQIYYINKKKLKGKIKKKEKKNNKKKKYINFSSQKVNKYTDTATHIGIHLYIHTHLAPPPQV